MLDLSDGAHVERGMRVRFRDSSGNLIGGGSVGGVYPTVAAIELDDDVDTNKLIGAAAEVGRKADATR